MSIRLRRHRRLRALGGVLVAAALATACTPGGSDSRSIASGALAVDEVDGREKVPEIQVLTKTQAEDPTRFEMARIMVDSWNAAGIRASVRPVGSAELSSRTFTGKDYDVYMISYDATPARLDPDNLLSRFFSGGATKQGSNISLYENEDYDEFYLAQQRAEKMSTRRQAVYDAQEVLAEQQPAVPLVYPNTGAAYRSDKWAGIEVSVSRPVFSVANSESAEPLDGQDTMVVGTTTEPSTLNPITAALAQDQTPIEHIYDTLLRVNAQGELEPRAAESFDVSGSDISVSLRDDLAFNDGTEVTAEDVAFSIEYLRDNESPLYSAVLEGVKSVTANGEEVLIELERPQASFVAVALAQMPILPQHVWSKVKDPNAFTNDDPVGSGPFSLADRRPGESITFEANPAFYSPPEIETLRLAVLGSFDAAVGALTSGEIDMIDSGNTVGTQYQSLDDTSSITVATFPSHGWRGVHYNTSKPPFDDRHFRRALTALIPVQDLVDIAYQGEAAVGGSVVAPVLDKWHNQEVEALEYDPEAAESELEQAGYAFGPDGRLYYPKAANDARVDDNDVAGQR